MSWGNCVSKIFQHCIQGKQIFVGYHSNHCQGKFSSIHIKAFFILMIFLQTKTFSEAWNMRYFFRRFSIVCISMETGPKIWTCTSIFCGSVNFSFISIYWQIFKVVLFYLPKIYCFKEKGVMKSSYVIHLNWVLGEVCVCSSSSRDERSLNIWN